MRFRLDRFPEISGKPLEQWVTLRRELVFEQLPWMRLYRDDVRLPDGRVVEGYLHLETPGYAVIVPVDLEGRMGLVRSYKRGVDAVDVQPPAGVLDEGETPLETARRELLEELGAEAESWHPLGSFVLSGNYGAGLAHIFLATGCRILAEPNPGDLEEQQALWVDADTVRKAWAAGAFRQLGAAAALGLALEKLRRLEAGGER
jgi:ADP-ribose pyrophosphatase